MEYLPLFINLKNRSVLVVGGGTVAARKVRMLQLSGAIIKIVAATLCVELKQFLLLEKIIWVGKTFSPNMLHNILLVIVATNDLKLNTTVFRYAEKLSVLINTVDDKSKCSCIFPAIVDRNPILIGISSCGTAPVLTRILREKLELFLPESIGYVAKLAGIWRNKIQKYIHDVKSRRRFWEKIFYNGNVATLIEQGKCKEAEQFLQRSISSSDINIKKVGTVTLVGAGPGDKGLLTIRGLQAIQQADVILYDYLINLDILDLARRDSEKICVGKRAGYQCVSQTNLNQIIIKLAQQGNNVIRLKGGDPFIFGRGGEELEMVSEFGIEFQVVPGITSGIGVAAYAGIPLTHRKYAHSVTFITGHRICDDENQLNWRVLSDSYHTLVVYMGKLNSMNVSKNLIFYGRHRDTPIAIISRGTYQDQKILISTLSKLEQLIFSVDDPVLIIIGNVVLLHNKIKWFNNDKHYMSTELI